MKSKLLKLLKNPTYENLSILFDLLWAHEKGRLSVGDLFTDEKYEIDIDFDQLEKIALKPTPFERINLFFNSISKSAWITFSVCYLIAMPFIVWFIYKWVAHNIGMANLSQVMVILSIILSVCVLGILILTLIINQIIQWFQQSRTIRDNKLIQSENYLSVFSATSIFAVTCALVIFGYISIQNTNILKNTTQLINDIEKKNVVRINLKDNSPRYIKAQYLDNIKNVKNLKDKLKTSKDKSQKACIYNALGVAYEYEGDLKNAEEAYTKSIGFDPDMIIFQLNKANLAQYKFYSTK